MTLQYDLMSELPLPCENGAFESAGHFTHSKQADEIFEKNTVNS